MRICLLFFLLLNVYGFCWSYSKDQYYTGGFGGEVFVSPINASTEFNIVFQLKRFIASASYSIDDDFYQSWNALFGVDVFENKYFKVVPFVGGYDPWMAGLQFEYRPYISGVANDVPMGIYWCVKAKYVYKYGENACEAGTGKDGVLRCYVDGSPEGPEKNKQIGKHRFYLGVGLHFW